MAPVGDSVNVGFVTVGVPYKAFAPPLNDVRIEVTVGSVPEALESFVEQNEAYRRVLAPPPSNANLLTKRDRRLIAARIREGAPRT